MGNFMYRRIAVTLSLIIAGLLAVPVLASATTTPPYPAPPVTPGTAAWTPVVEPAVAHGPSTALASTGAGFSVTTALIIGAVVLVAGLAMLFAGNRLRKSAHR
jgi:hypothetical protein